ncbi:MAG: FAD-dependent oxidoreductase [Alphaproteobacteria bacterium]|nr:FAD-dependent oxidoreductase [Alphaproteobacteria bacterium]
MLSVDLCVIGAGSGGLTVAAGASQMGASVALIERDRMGGDCLNFGCVPSKALLAAGHAAEAMRRADRLGVERHEPRVDFARVMDHVQGVIDAIAPNDSRERFEGLGVRVIKAEARFTAGTRLEAGGETIQARRVVIATGSAPMVPPIPGLAETPYLTNETVFANDRKPSHLIVVGGGPVGLELAQAHRRLGSTVTVIEMKSILPKDDPELVDVVRAALLREGVILLENSAVARVDKTAGGVVVSVKRESGELRVAGSHLLVAAGRKPNVDGLNLAAAGVAFGPGGIVTDRRLRTSNRRIYAIGDVTGRFPFTHAASYHAAIVLRNALFRWPAKVDDRAMPWVTYTDPELAQVGMSEAAARALHGKPIVLRWPFHENDRAQAERTTEGFAKVVLDRRGRILGASIVGPHAGELLQPWCLAIAKGMNIGAMAGLVVPYPTLGEVNKRLAGSWYAPKLFSDTTRRIVRFLMRLG